MSIFSTRKIISKFPKLPIVSICYILLILSLVLLWDYSLQNISYNYKDFVMSKMQLDVLTIGIVWKSKTPMIKPGIVALQEVNIYSKIYCKDGQIQESLPKTKKANYCINSMIDDEQTCKNNLFGTKNGLYFVNGIEDRCYIHIF